MKQGHPLRPQMPPRACFDVPPFLSQVAMMMDLAQPIRGLRHACLRESLARVNTASVATKEEQQRVLCRSRKRGRKCTDSAAGLPYLPPGVKLSCDHYMHSAEPHRRRRQPLSRGTRTAACGGGSRRRISRQGVALPKTRGLSRAAAEQDSISPLSLQSRSTKSLPPYKDNNFSSGSISLHLPVRPNAVVDKPFPFPEKLCDGNYPFTPDSLSTAVGDVGPTMAVDSNTGSGTALVKVNNGVGGKVGSNHDSLEGSGVGQDASANNDDRGLEGHDKDKLTSSHEEHVEASGSEQEQQHRRQQRQWQSNTANSSEDQERLRGASSSDDGGDHGHTALAFDVLNGDNSVSTLASSFSLVPSTTTSTTPTMAADYAPHVSEISTIRSDHECNHSLNNHESLLSSGALLETASNGSADGAVTEPYDPISRPRQYSAHICRPIMGHVEMGESALVRRGIKGQCGSKGGLRVYDGDCSRHPFVLKVLPTLPGVDDHQLPAFRLAELHESMRRDRAALKNPFRHRASRARPLSPPAETQQDDYDRLINDGRPRLMTKEEQDLAMVVRYFLRFGAKGGREGLTLQDLETAFRASRRADAFMAIEKKGKAAFAKCLAMLDAHGLSPEAWLEELLSKNRRGDSFTTFDMGVSIRAYNRAKPTWVRSHKQWLRGFMITEKDVRWCLRFVDPDGNTDVDAEELTNAVTSTLDGKPRISPEESRAVTLILEFERFMSVNRIRLVDLFGKVDKDKGGTIDEDELREFIRLGQQDARGISSSRQAWRRREEVAKWEEEKGRRELRRRAVQAKEHLARARSTGAYDVLNSVRAFTKTTGLRISDLIQVTGADPDEGMTPEQLVEFFARVKHSTRRFSKHDLERLVLFFDENNDRLLSLGEIQRALARQGHDELLLRQLAKAVALHVMDVAGASSDVNSANDVSSIGVLSTATGPDGHSIPRNDLGDGSGTVSRIPAALSTPETAECGGGGSICTNSSSALDGAGNNVHDNYMWILDNTTSIDSIMSVEGIRRNVSLGERRVAHQVMDPFVPRASFKVQAGSNFDPSWLPGFDRRFECQRIAQGQRLLGGSCTWYTN